MRRTALALAMALTLVAPAAYAADMALKAAPAPAPMDPWAGWYAGVNIGGSFGKANDSTSVGAPPAFFTTSSTLNGVIGGGQIGYNLRNSNWLFGLEADIQGSSERSTTNTGVLGGNCSAIAIVPCVGSLSDQEKIDWFGTVRGRLGVLASPTWLFYVTGGLAYGEIKSTETVSTPGGFLVPAGAAVNNFNTTRTGWTAGGGIEGVVSGNWTAKVEYLYMDFGTFNNTFAGVAPFTPVTLGTHVTDNIVRAGLNYHFH
jgi:outer membrane immunogenic protein